ncbi:hypothetical protein ACFC5Z_37050 [Streptomyces sp. NPDC056004]|uniref:hypothetical protein n=1 Tax=Streptomyces sp. NPDC056004 TaxID=3345677 RepID=UPI0035D71D8E
MTAAGTVGAGGQRVFGGVDLHADTIHAAVVTDNGGHLADAECPTTTARYTAALAFLGAHGDVIAIGVGRHHVLRNRVHPSGPRRRTERG